MPRDDPQAVEALILIEVKDGVIDGLRSMPYHHGPGGVRFDEPKTEDPSGSKTWIGDVAELAHAARDDLADISLDEAVAGLGRMGFHSFLRWDPPA